MWNSSHGWLTFMEDALQPLVTWPPWASLPGADARQVLTHRQIPKSCTQSVRVCVLLRPGVQMIQPCTAVNHSLTSGTVLLFLTTRWKTVLVREIALKWCTKLDCGQMKDQIQAQGKRARTSSIITMHQHVAPSVFISTSFNLIYTRLMRITCFVFLVFFFFLEFFFFF